MYREATTRSLQWIDDALKGAGGFVPSAKLLFLNLTIRSDYSQRLSYDLLSISFPLSSPPSPYSTQQSPSYVREFCLPNGIWLKVRRCQPSVHKFKKACGILHPFLGEQFLKPADFRAKESLPAIDARLNWMTRLLLA